MPATIAYCKPSFKGLLTAAYNLSYCQKLSFPPYSQESVCHYITVPEPTARKRFPSLEMVQLLTFRVPTEKYFSARTIAEHKQNIRGLQEKLLPNECGRV